MSRPNIFLVIRLTAFHRGLRVRLNGLCVRVTLRSCDPGTFIPGTLWFAGHRDYRSIGEKGCPGCYGSKTRQSQGSVKSICRCGVRLTNHDSFRVSCSCSNESPNGKHFQSHRGHLTFRYDDQSFCRTRSTKEIPFLLSYSLWPEKRRAQDIRRRKDFSD